MEAGRSGTLRPRRAMNLPRHLRWPRSIHPRRSFGRPSGSPAPLRIMNAHSEPTPAAAGQPAPVTSGSLPDAAGDSAPLVSPICVTGMHRSGTSMVTHLLHVCGLHLGDESLLKAAADDNPEGFWEHEEFVGINDELLAL